MKTKYIQAENLKHKRTFTKKLIVIAPLVVSFIPFLAPAWFQITSYNWWYVMIYPGLLTIVCALIEQRDNGKLKYHACASLPVSQNNIWKAKINIASIYSLVSNLIFLLLNISGGFAILFINKIPLKIGIWQATAGIVCIFISSMWQIPLCLWLSKKTNLFITLIVNAGIGSVLGTLAATESFWIICPYSWMPHLMSSVVGILPNDLPASPQDMSMTLGMIIFTLLISIALFALISFVTSSRFEKQEVG